MQQQPQHQQHHKELQNHQSQTPPPSPDREAGPQPAPFLRKAFAIIEDPSTDDIISWNNDGTSFVVWKPSELAVQLLPLYFKHNNFSSFVRQLNTYGFRKIDPDRWSFANEGFQKGQPGLLGSIQRRKPVSSMHNGSSSAPSDGPSSSQQDGPPGPHHSVQEQLPPAPEQPPSGDAEAQALGRMGSSHSAFSKPPQSGSNSDVLDRRPSGGKRSAKRHHRHPISKDKSQRPDDNSKAMRPSPSERESEQLSWGNGENGEGISRPIALSLNPSNILSDLATQRGLLTQLATQFLELKSENISLKQQMDAWRSLEAGPSTHANPQAHNFAAVSSGQSVKSESEWQMQGGSQPSAVNRIDMLENHMFTQNRHFREQGDVVINQAARTCELEQQFLLMVQKYSDLERTVRDMEIRLQESTATAERNALDQMLGSVRGILQGMHQQHQQHQHPPPSSSSAPPDADGVAREAP